jgi:hypothetical protein
VTVLRGISPTLEAVRETPPAIPSPARDQLDVASASSQVPLVAAAGLADRLTPQA